MDYQWPQFAMIAMYGIGIGLELARNGQPKKDTHNVWWTLIGVGISVFLLRSGGFF